MEISFGERKALLASHIDLDGISCVIAAKYFKVPFRDIMIKNYDDFETRTPIQYMLGFDVVWFTDLTPPRDQLEELLEAGIEVKMFDHHASAQESLSDLQHPNIEYIFREETSGTRIFFEYLKAIRGTRISKVANQYLDLVDTYDLYQRDSELWPEAQNLNRLFWGYLDFYYEGLPKYDKYIKRVLQKFERISEWRWLTDETKVIEKALQKEKAQYEAAMKTLKTREDSRGAKFGIFQARSKISAVCSMVLDRYKGFDYLIAVNTYRPNELKLSLRARDYGFDLLQLDRVRGHSEASGSELTHEEIEALWNTPGASIPYREETEPSV